MNCLVHQRTAAIQFPGAAPGAAVVIRLRPEPFHLGIADGQLAETAAVDRTFQLQARVVKSAGKDGPQLDARFVAFLDDLVATLERNLQRLFDDHVLAGAGGCKGRLHVGAAGRADRHDVHVGIGEHLVQFVIGAATGRRRQPVGRRGKRIEARDEFRPAHVVDRLGMKVCNHAATDNAESKSHNPKSPSQNLEAAVPGTTGEGGIIKPPVARNQCLGAPTAEWRRGSRSDRYGTSCRPFVGAGVGVR